MSTQKCKQFGTAKIRLKKSVLPTEIGYKKSVLPLKMG